MREIQAVLDAIKRGEPVHGYIREGKLRVDLDGPSVFPTRQNTSLAKWLSSGGSKQIVPIEIIKQEMERQQREEHHCADNPCPAMLRIHAILDAIQRGQPVKGYIQGDKLLVEIGSTKSSALEKANNPLK
jgi:hypothetical protein